MWIVVSSGANGSYLEIDMNPEEANWSTIGVAAKLISYGCINKAEWITGKSNAQITPRGILRVKYQLQYLLQSKWLHLLDHHHGAGTGIMLASLRNVDIVFNETMCCYPESISRPVQLLEGWCSYL